MFGIRNIIYENNNNSFIIKIGNDSENIILYNGILKVIDNEIAFNYLVTLFSIIDNWDIKYINTQTIDGDSWNLSINYVDGRKREHYGHAHYPSNFEALERLTRKLIDEVI